MKIILIFSLLSSIFLSSNAFTAGLDEINLLSEDFPPYNYVENGQAKGISIDIMSLLLKKTKSQKTIKDISFYPWGRSYNLVLTSPKQALFVMTKTKERENKFKWVGPISTARNVLIGNSDLIVPEKMENFYPTKSYCVVKNDAGEQILISKIKVSPAKLSVSPNIKSCLKMLLAKRVDFIAYDLNVTKFVMKRNNMDTNLIKEALLLEEGQHYFAFSISTPDSLIHELQTIIDHLNKSGEIEKIIKSHAN